MQPSHSPLQRTQWLSLAGTSGAPASLLQRRHSAVGDGVRHLEQTDDNDAAGTAARAHELHTPAHSCHRRLTDGTKSPIGCSGVQTVPEAHRDTAQQPCLRHWASCSVCFRAVHATQCTSADVFPWSRFINTASAMAELLQLDGQRYACGPLLADPVHVGGAEGQPVEVMAGSAVAVESTMWLLANIVVEEGELIRMSPVLLHRLAQAAASAVGTVPSALYVGTAVPLSSKSWFAPANRAHGKWARGCTSPFHAPTSVADKDPRVRRRCVRCAETEINIHRAMWPVMAVIARSVVPWFYTQVVNGFAGDVRRRLVAALTPAPGHLLQLTGTAASNRALALVAGPSATVMLRIRRSKLRDIVCSALPTLVSKGWVRVEAMKATTSLRLMPDILRHHNTLYMPHIPLIAEFLATQKPDFVLTRPGHPLAINGRPWPAFLAIGGTIRGWRCGKRCPKFETVLALGARLGCTLKDVGPDHFSSTKDRAEREQLVAESNNPWLDLVDIEELVVALANAKTVGQAGPHSGRLALDSHRVSPADKSKCHGHAVDKGAAEAAGAAAGVQAERPSGAQKRRKEAEGGATAEGIPAGRGG